MSTRSNIAIAERGGGVTSIYCHHDGYLSHNGRILFEFYTTEESVRELLALGSLSSLGQEIGKEHPFDKHLDNPEWKSWCLAYGRDRGEDSVEATYYISLSEWRGDDQEYNYIFDPPTRTWQVACGSTGDKIIRLVDALEKDD